MTLTIQFGCFFCLGIVFAQKLRIIGLSLIVAVICVFHAVTASDDLLSTVGMCIGQITMMQFGFAIGVWARAVIAPMLFRTARAG